MPGRHGTAPAQTVRCSPHAPDAKMTTESMNSRTAGQGDLTGRGNVEVRVRCGVCGGKEWENEGCGSFTSAILSAPRLQIASHPLLISANYSQLSTLNDVPALDCPVWISILTVFD